MVREHETRDAGRRVGRVGREEVGGGAGECDLNAGGSPGDEGREAAFADAEEGFVNLVVESQCCAEDVYSICEEGYVRPWVLLRP